MNELRDDVAALLTKHLQWVERHKITPHWLADAVIALVQEREIIQSIESAPKDGTKIIAYYRRAGWICPVWWDDDRNPNREPRPFWFHWGTRICGLQDARDNPPTHWRPMPEPPKGITGESK